MKRITVVFAALALLVTVPACVNAPKAGMAGGGSAEEPLTRASIERRLDEWLPGMGAPNLVDRERPQQEFEQLCFRVGRPGAEAARALLCRAVIVHIGPQTPRPARVWLLRQLERLSGAESVSAVAKTLAEDDPEIRDLARRVLQKNPSPAAAATLRKALDQTDDPEWQVALLNALAARRDEAAVSQFIRYAGHSDLLVAAAAIAGLGDVGNRKAIDALSALCSGPEPVRRGPAAAVLVRVADRLVETGHSRRAASLYASVYDPAVKEPLRAGALRGLATADPAQAVPRLLDTIRGQRDPSLRLLAVRLLAGISGEYITSTLVAELPNVPPDVQVVMLDALAGRGEPNVKPAILKALSSGDARVRIAAVEALQQVGGAADIVVLGNFAAQASGPERDAARRALARLLGEGVDTVILSNMKIAAPALRAELIRALSARRYKPALPTFFHEATQPDEAVRVAALNALGELGAPDDAPALLQLLSATDGDAARSAAEDAVVAVCNRIEAPEQRAAPVLVQWPHARTEARPAFVTVLGRLGGDAALNEIRAARASGNADLVDAAVRALAQWTTADVLDDLLDVARHSDTKTHRVLALTGYIRLLGLPSDREPAATVALYQTALSLAERPDEKKQILSGLSNVQHLDALRLAQQCLSDEALRNEAESAVISTARLVGPWHVDEAQSAVRDIMAQTASDATRERGEKTLDAIRKSQGCILTWSMAGPYFAEGQKWTDILDTAFPPEQLGAPGVEWRPLKTTNSNQPWVFDLTQIDSGGDRCVYVRSAVWSAEPQDVRLDVGSDDAVKVWLNGRLAHEFRGIRAHEALQDKVAVTLEAGWNTLLLKVVQASGGWGFSCALRTPEGEPLTGLKLQAAVPTGQ
jgi:HEAT repeat protein